MEAGGGVDDLAFAESSTQQSDQSRVLQTGAFPSSLCPRSDQSGGQSGSRAPWLRPPGRGCLLPQPAMASSCLLFFYGTAIYFLMKLLFLPECICYCAGVYATVPADGREEAACHYAVLNFFLVLMADWF